MSKEVPEELIHHIQSLLPVKEAARSCILSKWWLCAWSTIPTVRLSSPKPGNKYYTDEQETNYKNRIHCTLQRYHQNNLPIEYLHLELHINNKDQLASLPKTWIQPVVSKTCLKHLSLEILVFPDDNEDSSLFTLPYELFSSQNLDTISVTSCYFVSPLRLTISSSTHIIRCVSLRVLHLQNVVISEDVFNNLVSTCTLLEKIKLWCCEGLKKNVKLTNLVHLRDLKISSLEEDGLWDITNVPTLASFYFSSMFGACTKPIPFQMESLAASSLTQLHLEGLVIDNSFFDIVKAKFPLLQSLTLGIGRWVFLQLVITSDSLKWLTLVVSETRPFSVQVHAPALLSFTYTGLYMIPRLSFPSIAPERINLTFNRREPMNHSFFLKMREALNLSSKFDIKIIHSNNYGHQEDSLVPSNIDVDDLKTRFSSHVTNLQLSLTTSSDARVWEHSRFFDACFSICRPNYIMLPKPAVRKMIEGKTIDLIDVQLKNPLNGNWEALTCSRNSLLDTLDDHFPLECKLNWLSQ